MNKKLVLVIMYGWGIGDRSTADAIAMANTPFIKQCYQQYPHSKLNTSGKYVGLPDGQMGNSEVGHLNIGAGRVVYQDLVKINKAIKDKTIDANPTLLGAFAYAKAKQCKVHFMGLLSDGGVHSTQQHLHHLCDMAIANGLSNVFVHAFTDGRDTDPKSGLKFLTALEQHLYNSPIKIASVIGRYYAMDRDKRWERIKIAYDALVNGRGEATENILEAVEKSYKNGISDEFIKPYIKVDAKGNALATISENDVVICFNFRTDRCREITEVLSQTDKTEFGMRKLNLHFLTMTNYDATFSNIKTIFEKQNLSMTLGETLSKASKTQIRIAETEKYPHVTFFFSGGREQAFAGEQRLLVPSPKIATYDLQPEMSAFELSNKIIPELKKATTDFICLNFANADMVGHTGVYPAIIKAVETVDNCVKNVVEAGLEYGYSFLIIADHGNADCAINIDGTPNTAHTTNPVPCILIDKEYKKIRNGKLADLAPTILKIMNITIPPEMDGEVLV